MSRERAAFALLLLVCSLAYARGVRWGLGIAERKALVFGAEKIDPGLAETIAKTREELYQRLGVNVSAHTEETGEYNLRVDRPGEAQFLISAAGRPPSDNLLMSYSSFLMRSKHPDEQKVIVAISHLNPVKLKLNPHNFQYGGAYLYSLAALYKLCAAAGLLKLVPDTKYYYDDSRAMEGFYVVGRLYAAAAMLGCVAMIFLIGRRIGSWPAGLLAAAVFGLSPAIVVHSHIMKPHPLAAFFALLAAYFSVRIHEDGSARWYRLGGAAVGLAAGTAFNAGLIALIVALAHFLRRGERLSAKLVDRRVWESGAIAALFFLLTNPYVLLDHKEFVNDLGYASHWYPFTLSPRTLGYFFSYSLKGALGLPALSWLLACWATLTWRPASWRDRLGLLVAFVLAAVVVVSGMVGAVYASPENVRFFFYLLGLLILVAADRWARLVTRPAAWGALALAFLPMAAQSLRYERGFIKDGAGSSYSAQAGRWINSNIRAGARVGLLSYTPHVENLPPFRFADYDLIALRPEALNAQNRDLPEYLVDGTMGESQELLIKINVFYRPLMTFGSAEGCGPLTNADFPVRVYRRN